ncbi:Cullin-3 [Balamuthia mandrillaris]
MAVMWEELEEGCKALRALLAGGGPSDVFGAKEYDALCMTCADLKSMYKPTSADVFARYMGFCVAFLDELAARLEPLSGAAYVNELLEGWTQFSLYATILLQLMQTMYYSEHYYYIYSKEFLKRLVATPKFVDVLPAIIPASFSIDDQQYHNDAAEIDHFVLVNKIFEMLVGINAGVSDYILYFEIPFLRDRGALYGRKCQHLLSISPTLVEYFEEVDRLKRHEEALPLPKRTRGELSALVLKLFLFESHDLILERLQTTWKDMLHTRSENDVKMVYTWIKTLGRKAMELWQRLLREVIIETAYDKTLQLLQAANALTNDDKNAAPSKKATFAVSEHVIECLLDFSKFHKKYSALCEAFQVVDGVNSNADDLQSQQQVRLVQSQHVTIKKWNELLYAALDRGVAQPVDKHLLPAHRLEEILASACHQHQAKFYSEEQMESFLEAVSALCSHLTDKDIFAEYYKRLLIKRTLLSLSESIDQEKLMLVHLKAAMMKGGMSASIFGRAEMVLQDMVASSTYTENFKTFLSTSPKAKEWLSEGRATIDANIKVISQFCYPYALPPRPVLPEEFLQFQVLFAKFYNEVHSNRVLNWIYPLCGCHMTAFLNNKKLELVLSLHQAILLLLFNNIQQLSIRQMAEMTDLPSDSAIRPIVQQLLKFKILLLSPNSKDKSCSASTSSSRPSSSAASDSSCSSSSSSFIDDQTFIINERLRTKRNRLKLNQTQKRQNNEERNKTVNYVLMEREFVVKALIVRIMKTSKSLTHRELVQEVFSKLKFPYEAKLLKKRIEGLLSEKYIERDQQQHDLYHYVA